MNFSSDSMCPHFVGELNGRFDKLSNYPEKLKLQHLVLTIVWNIVFPAH